MLSRRVRITLGICAGVVVSVTAAALVVARRFEPIARDYVINAIRQRYKGEVELANLQISLLPEVHATGEHLTVRTAGNEQLPPLISARRFTLDASFVEFFRSPKRIRRLRLEGLQIHVPPRHSEEGRKPVHKPLESSAVPFLLEEIIADGTMLETLPADSSKDRLTFDIHQLTLHTVGLGKPLRFHAELNNPKPPGFIHTDGEFGPWDQDEPSNTPVQGKYTFSNADLGVFKSISGTLSSSGEYRGELDRIEVQGTTDVPNFALTATGQPEHLRTRFQATVDGTNGNTYLHPVSALLGKSAFEVTGPIERNALEKGREIDLTAHASGTGLDDFLKLTVKGQGPPMVGAVKFDTTVKIPPGKTPVVERVELNGKFSLAGVSFTSADVQQKIASLSHHAQGDPKNTATNDVTARFAGRFILHRDTLSLPRLEFDVPGATVSMDGHYAVQSGEIDFRGTARLDATVSEMTTGVKHVLLKAVDPLFRHDGSGAVVPIRITGTRGSPSFKLDIGRVFTRENVK